jgi:hypothetical protein
MNKVPGSDNWIAANASTFWSNIARYDHVVQLYDNDEIFIDTLTGFVEDAIHSNENAVVIATEPHLNALEKLMARNGMHIDKLMLEGQFIPLDVEEIVAEFMIDGKADESRIKETISNLFIKAGYNKNRFRLSGEIAPTLFAQGHREVAARVEHLTEIFNNEKPGSIFCAYSKNIFCDSAMNFADAICDEHSKIISGSEKQLTQVLYREKNGANCC